MSDASEDSDQSLAQTNKASSDRREDDRRNVQLRFEGQDRRKANRRSGEDRRKNERRSGVDRRT